MESLGLIIVGVVALILFNALSNSGGRTRRNHRYPPKINRPTKAARNPSNNWGMTDPENQWAAVTSVSFRKSKLVNRSELRVLKTLEKTLSGLGTGHRVMAQTSLGELLKPETKSADWKTRKDAFASINSKRLDFSIVDSNGYLVLGVEYQGGGHASSTSASRDRIKREVLRRARVPLLEVEVGMKPSDLQSKVLEILDPKPNQKKTKR